MKNIMAVCFFCRTTKFLTLKYYNSIMKKTKGLYLCTKCGGNKKVPRRKQVVIQLYNKPFKLTNKIIKKLGNKNG